MFAFRYVEINATSAPPTNHIVVNPSVMISTSRSTTNFLGYLVIGLLILILIIIASCVKIVPQAQAYVVERLGAYQGTWSVGFHFKTPLIDKIAKKIILKEQVD